jgi:hypothetical protein
VFEIGDTGETFSQLKVQAVVVEEAGVQLIQAGEAQPQVGHQPDQLFSSCGVCNGKVSA